MRFSAAIFVHYSPFPHLRAKTGLKLPYREPADTAEPVRYALCFCTTKALRKYT